LVLGILFTYVVWRFDSKRDKFFSIASKIASIFLLGLLIYNPFVEYNSWALDLFFTLGPIGCFLIIIAVEAMIEFPEWKDWFKHW
jgi:O-antigen/teichoic acid export membrane protein